MAKLNIEVNVTGAKDVKTLEKALKQLESGSAKVEKQNTKTTKSMKAIVVQSALVIGAVYAIQRAIREVTSAGFEYNASLEQAREGLIALSVVAQDKAIPLIDRQANAYREAAYTLSELQKINAETPHTLNQTNAIYKAMYISMRGVGATTDDMINLTKKLSIAAGAAGIEFNGLLAGVDGLASGTVMANSDLGRLLGGLGLTNTKLKETKDVVGLVSEALEDFRAADTMAVAISNMTNAWTIFAGNVTQPIFDGTKKALNEVSKMLSTYAPQAVQIFSDSLVDMANAGVQAIGFVLKTVNQLIGLLQTSYAGYVKLSGLLQSGSISEATADIAELQRIQKEGDYGYFSNQSYNIVRKNIKAKQEEIEQFKAANELRREGERIQERAVSRTNAINDIVNSGIEKIHINYGKVKTEVEDLAKPLETAFKPIAAKSSDKEVKAAKKQAKRLREAYEKEAEKLQDAFSSVGDALAGSISSALGPIASELHAFYKDVQGLMAQASATSQAQSQAEGAAATGPAVAKAGSQGGLYGAIGMAALLAAFGMAASGGLSSFFGGGEATPPELEDQKKTSESMANSLEKIQDAQYPMLQLTRDMRGYLSVIANSFGAIENSLLRSDIDFAGNYYEEQTKSGAGGLSSKDYTLYGTSLDFEAASIAEILSEQLSVTRDTVIKKVYDSFWKTKTTYFHNLQNVSDLFAEDIADATASLFSGFTEIGGIIGLSLEGLIDEVIDIGKIDTTGKTSQEIAEEIEARFSAATDAIAEEYLGVVSEFQRAGEGLAETAFRVALTFDQVSHSMSLIDKNVTWRTANIIEEVAGGIDNLSMNLTSYMENFFTEQEQYEMQVTTMTKSFETLGYSLPKTNKDFRTLIEGLDTTTDEGAALFAEIITLSDGFAQMTASAEDLNNAQADFSDIADLLLGRFSNLSIAGKKMFSEEYSQLAAQSDGTISTIDSARREMELAYKYATTQEEYGVYVDRLVTQLKNEIPEKTNDDIVDRLDILIDETRSMTDMIQQTSI